ncbi:MAG: putative acetyltransferase C complex catalytic subunit Mak3, partial [Benniella sp.]
MTKSKGKSKPKSKQKSGSTSAQGHASPSPGQPPEVHDSDSNKDLEAGEAAATQQQQVERPQTSALASIPEDAAGETLPPIEYIGYESEHQLPEMISLIENDLSEPYSIYTYRYFLHQWPKLSFLAMDKEKDKCIGVIVCRLDTHGNAKINRGYIAMLAVSKDYRKRKIGSTLALMAIQAMKDAGADEIVLETEYTNTSAIALYQRMGFIKDKRLYRYYLNGVDAFRLKLFCRPELIGAKAREGMDMAIDLMQPDPTSIN